MGGLAKGYLKSMGNIIAYIYKRLCEKYAKFGVAKRDAETRRVLAEKNPTCRIISVALSDVVLGKYVAILGGAILDKVYISDCSYISNNSKLWNVEIGKYCSISSNVQIGFGSHPSRTFVSTYPAFYSNENPGCPTSFRESKIFDDDAPRTFLANDVWIGANVIIPGGIHVGTGAIVAAGSVVVKDVPPYAVVGGNPAKIIRYRFSEEQIKLLLTMAWWDWPIEKIQSNVDYFSDIEKLLGSEKLGS